MEAEPGREIYRRHRERLGRHLLREDRSDYSLEDGAVFTAVCLDHGGYEVHVDPELDGIVVPSRPFRAWKVEYRR